VPKPKKEMLISDYGGDKLFISVADYEKGQMFGKPIPKGRFYRKVR